MIRQLGGRCTITTTTSSSSSTTATTTTTKTREAVVSSTKRRTAVAAATTTTTSTITKTHLIPTTTSISNKFLLEFLITSQQQQQTQRQYDSFENCLYPGNSLSLCNINNNNLKTCPRIFQQPFVRHFSTTTTGTTPPEDVVVVAEGTILNTTSGGLNDVRSRKTMIIPDTFYIDLVEHTQTNDSSGVVNHHHHRKSHQHKTTQQLHQHLRECRTLVNTFDDHLRGIFVQYQNEIVSSSTTLTDENMIDEDTNENSPYYDKETKEKFLASGTVINALKCLTQCCVFGPDYKKVTTKTNENNNNNDLNRYYLTDEQFGLIIRQWESLLGNCKGTILTNELSTELLRVNSYAGNIGRVLALLQIRQKRKYPPTTIEFIYSIQAIIKAMQQNPYPKQNNNNNNKYLRSNGTYGTTGNHQQQSDQMIQLSLIDNRFPRGKRKNNRFNNNQQQQQKSLSSFHLRNVYLHDKEQPTIDNPTRWLDSILLNMSQRNFILKKNDERSQLSGTTTTGGSSNSPTEQESIDLVNLMLQCYTAPNGRSGMATHFFYKVSRQPILDPNIDHWEEQKKQPNYSYNHQLDTTNMPTAYFSIPDDNVDNDMDKKYNIIKTGNHVDDNEQNNSTTSSPPPNRRYRNGKKVERPMKISIRYETLPPPFYKMPSRVKGKFFFLKPDGIGVTLLPEKTIHAFSDIYNTEKSFLVQTTTDTKATNAKDRSNQMEKLSPKQIESVLLEKKRNKSIRGGQYRYEREMDPKFCPTLSAAFAFADSIEQGACGHEPIELDTNSYNHLLRACVYRGSLWRAMFVIDHDMVPGTKTAPTILSYNYLLEGFARVGDVHTAQEYMYKLLNAGLEPDEYTVRAITNGLLNMGDISSAITVTQDFYNQHNILPPSQQHLKILEMCLATNQIYEAKRYCYFIQQLWHWNEKDSKHYTTKFIRLMKATQRNELLQKPAIIRLFQYFGVPLNENTDFL